MSNRHAHPLTWSAAAACLAVLLLPSASAFAASSSRPAATQSCCSEGSLAPVAASSRGAAPAMTDRTEPLPPALVGVGIDQKIGAMLPLDAAFRDENGKAVTLGDYFQSGRPVILHLMYSRCPSVCPAMQQQLLSALADLPPGWNVGAKFDLLTVSFDPQETPATAKAHRQEMLAVYGHASAEQGWHVLTGDEADIRRLTDAVGYQYKWNSATNMFAHPAALMVVSPRGQVTHYIAGASIEPASMRLALVDASAGKLGSLSDSLAVWTCFSFDHTTGTYTFATLKLFRAVAVLTIVALLTAIGLFTLRARHRRRHAPALPRTTP